MKYIGKLLLNFLHWLSRLFHIHEWYGGTYSLGARSEFTGDLIGRHERHCLSCQRKELSISQLSNVHKEEVINFFGKHKWYVYTNGDWLDNYTKKHLIGNSIKENNFQKNQDDLFRIIGGGSDLMKFY